MSGPLVALPMLLLGVQAPPPRPVPLILDTDIGGDIDDTWALLMLLGCPQVDLKLVVTAWDDTEAKTRLVAKILERVGRTDIPVGTGLKTSDAALNQAQWLGDYDLAGYGGTVHEDGVQAMVEMLRASPEPLTLLAIGPQTNLREALRRDPGIANKARLVSMAGSVQVGYNGKPEPDAEWNVVADVPAARAVLAAPWDITWAPLDSCGTMILSGERYAQVRDSERPRAKAVIENYDHWTPRPNYPPDASSVLFDTVAAYLTFDETLCRMETVHLSISDDGRTVPDEQGRPVSCALGWNDRDAFEELLVGALTR